MRAFGVVINRFLRAGNTRFTISRGAVCQICHSCLISSTNRQNPDQPNIQKSSKRCLPESAKISQNCQNPGVSPVIRLQFSKILLQGRPWDRARVGTVSVPGSAEAYTWSYDQRGVGAPGTPRARRVRAHPRRLVNPEPVGAARGRVGRLHSSVWVWVGRVRRGLQDAFCGVRDGTHTHTRRCWAFALALPATAALEQDGRLSACGLAATVVVIVRATAGGVRSAALTQHWAGAGASVVVWAARTGCWEVCSRGWTSTTTAQVLESDWN